MHDPDTTTARPTGTYAHCSTIRRPLLRSVTHEVIKIYETVELPPARSQQVILSTVWWWVISFTIRPLYPRGKCVRYAMDPKSNGIQSWSRRFSEQKNSFHLPGTKPQFLSHQARSLSKFLSKGSTGVGVFLAWRRKQNRLSKYRASLKN